MDLLRNQEEPGRSELLQYVRRFWFARFFYSDLCGKEVKIEILPRSVTGAFVTKESGKIKTKKGKKEKNERFKKF